MYTSTNSRENNIDIRDNYTRIKYSVFSLRTHVKIEKI